MMINNEVHGRLVPGGREKILDNTEIEFWRGGFLFV
jgi:hypothetical protein